MKSTCSSDSLLRACSLPSFHIERIGKLLDGLGLYEFIASAAFRFRNHPRRDRISLVKRKDIVLCGLVRRSRYVVVRWLPKKAACWIIVLRRHFVDVMAAESAL